MRCKVEKDSKYKKVNDNINWILICFLLQNEKKGNEDTNRNNNF